MSFYRTFITAVAAMGIATSVMADDTMATTDAMQATTTTETTTTSTSTETKINLNTASAKELAKVDGLNRARANAIVSYRKKHESEGGFKSVEDLRNVKALKKLSDDTMKKIEDQLTV